MNWYGKEYISNGGYQCRYWYHFSIEVQPRKTMGKRFGYWNIYYDGYFRFFSLWPFQCRWHKRPIMKVDGVWEKD